MPPTAGEVWLATWQIKYRHPVYVLDQAGVAVSDTLMRTVGAGEQVQAFGCRLGFSTAPRLLFVLVQVGC